MIYILQKAPTHSEWVLFVEYGITNHFSSNQVVIWRKIWVAGNMIAMKKRKNKYKDELIGKIKIVADFLPKPEKLVLKEETTKITISLTKSSIDFFKNVAAKHHTNYQTMIRDLIDQYVSHYRHLRCSKT